MSKVELPVMLLVGITERTNNAAETDPVTAKIGVTMGKFFNEGMLMRV